MRTGAVVAPFLFALSAALYMHVTVKKADYVTELHQYTFNVDPVEVESTPVVNKELDPINLCRKWDLWPGSHLEACYLSSALPTKNCFRISHHSVHGHGLIDAFLTSFTLHKRLVLRPDDIFFPLLDAAATHVLLQGSTSRASAFMCLSRASAFMCLSFHFAGEDARSIFVSHTGKKALSVNTDSFRAPGGPVNGNDWLGVLPHFRAQIIASTHHGSVEPALPSFTTTDAVTSAAFSATLMRGLQNFFEYRASTLCGIPSITLLGSEQDWSELRARFLGLAEMWMNRTPSTCEWAKAVDEMLAQFESARAGRVDVEWWRSIFKYNDKERGSGAEPHITGHMTCLFPWYDDKRWVGLRSRVSEVSSGSGSVPVEWNVLGNKQNMTLWSGFAGVCMDEAQERVAPAMGVAMMWNSE